MLARVLPHHCLNGALRGRSYRFSWLSLSAVKPVLVPPQHSPTSPTTLAPPVEPLSVISLLFNTQELVCAHMCSVGMFETKLRSCCSCVWSNVHGVHSYQRHHTA